MAFDDFKTIVSRLPRGLKRLSLTGLGESLLHPDFLGMLACARDTLPATRIDVTTNGTLLNEPMRRALVESGLWMLTFSIETVDETAEGFGHPAKRAALSNFLHFCEENRDAGKPVRTRLQVILGSEAQIREIVYFAVKTGVDAINFIRMDVPAGSGIRRAPEEQIRSLYRLARALCRERGIEYFCINDQNIFLRIATHFDRGCVLLDNFAYIDVDGNVLLCCFMRDFSPGNIIEKPLEEIWRSATHRRFSPESAPTCHACDIYKLHYNH